MNNSTAAAKRLDLLVKAILIRRTKDQIDATTGKTFVELPPKTAVEHKLTLNEDEQKVHEIIMAFSR